MSALKLLRIVQCLLALLAVITAFRGRAEERLAYEQPFSFTLSALGEVETESGGWRGVDVLETPGAAVDRVQVSFRLLEPARAILEVVSADGTVRLFPRVGEPPLMRPGTHYALPGPDGFYDVKGDLPVRLRLHLIPERKATAPATAAAMVGGRVLSEVPLSDGAPFLTGERAFRAAGPSTVELPLRGR